MNTTSRLLGLLISTEPNTVDGDDSPVVATIRFTFSPRLGSEKENKNDY